jgi:hypothetical protein
MNSHLNQSNHLVGISNSNVVIQFAVCIFFINHLRFDIVSITVPARSSFTLITRFSIGSCLCPFISLKITCGAHTCSSRHSLRMLSINTHRCSSHLQDTINFQSSISTLSHTFVSTSFRSLSSIFLVVIYFHSLPANGESFTKNSIFNVGSSIAIVGRANTFQTPIVSHTKIEGIPLIVIISPHCA